MKPEGKGQRQSCSCREQEIRKGRCDWTKMASASCWKSVADGAEVTCNGRLFQMRKAATGNALSPTVSMCEYLASSEIEITFLEECPLAELSHRTEAKGCHADNRNCIQTATVCSSKHAPAKKTMISHTQQKTNTKTSLQHTQKQNNLYNSHMRPVFQHKLLLYRSLTYFLTYNASVFVGDKQVNCCWKVTKKPDYAKEKADALNALSTLLFWTKTNIQNQQ